MKIRSNHLASPSSLLVAAVFILLSGAAHGEIVFQQDFQSCGSTSCYVSPDPGIGQFNDLSTELNGGTWSITQGRLQLTRTGASGSNNGAGFTRFKNFTGSPSVLHITFELGVTANMVRNDSLVLDIGNISSFSDYNNTTPHADLFSRLSIDLEGSNTFTFEISGADSTPFPANGTSHSVSYFLNGSGAARSYLAPDGSTRSLDPNRVALWVGTTVLFDNVPRTHGNPALTDLRVHFAQSDVSTWHLDDLVISNEFPTGTSSQAVTHFTLINADTDQPLPGFDPLPDGATLALGTLPTRNLNIRAHTSPLTVGSVRFALDGDSNFRTENVAPYALAGDTNGDYHAWTPGIGMHTLKATPFSASNASGTAGTARTLHFIVGIDPRSSLAVTDEVILKDRFSFQRFMDHLVTQSGVSGLTSLQLFRQWWDTQNPAPGLGLGAHCDDNGGTLNSFPYNCRPADGEGDVVGEGDQASVNPFTGDENSNPDFYKPIGLFNRFDQAPVDGAHCGEYRLIYARAGAPTDTHPTNPGLRRRNLAIFEAVLPNPQPASGLEGCRPVVEFWANLSRLDAATRASELERFFFVGLTGFPPAAHVTHFGTRVDNLDNPLGQVRTNQFLQEPWLLREFRLVNDCDGGACSLKMVPVTVKPNPFGPLFGPNGVPAHSRTGDFQDFFPNQVSSLSANDINAIGFLINEQFGRFNAAGSPNALDMTRPPFENNYAIHFQAAPGSFRSEIQAQIPSDSGLTPEHIVLRAQALSCAGCHQLNNNVDIGGGLTWPPSNIFVQVSELVQESGPDGPRFSISPALTDVFLPHRKKVLEDFLNGMPSATQLSFQAATASDPEARTRPPRRRVPTLGGSTTH